jgi:glycosyltransferase involved in cell wall biosynthesis
MNVALSTTMIQRGKTGVAQYVFALVRALLAESGGHRYTLLVLEEDRSLFEFVGDRMAIAAVPERFRPAVRNIGWHQAVLPGWLRARGIDVLHVPSYRRLLWRRPCGLVATIHDLAPFHVAGKYDWARMFYGRVVVRQLARRQDEIVAISRNTGQDIERFFGLPLARLNVIHNGIDHGRFQPGDSAAAKAAARERWGLDRRFFLYVSRLEHPAKNHVRLIEAFDRFKTESGSDWLLALGGSDWHGAEAIRAAAQRSPHAADIRFLGFVADAALPQLYRATDVFVYPSLFEGFGFPPVEAMACGCPVLSSTRGALAEVVAEAAATVEPEDVAGMASALRRLSVDPTWRAELRAAGFQNARRFDWATTAQATRAVYEHAARRAVVRRSRATNAGETP